MKKFTLVLIILLGAIFITSNLAFASYNYNQAASYADTWATSRNTLNYPSFPTDCTNFVSQCIHDEYGGTKAFDESGLYQWYCKKINDNWQYTNSWSIAHQLYVYFVYNPAALPVGNWGWISGLTTPPNYNSQLRLGDVVFYDWQSDSTLDHTGLIASTNGTDPNSQITGSLTDQHTKDRYHSIWHLKPYNAQWQTTTIRVYRPY